MSALAPLFLPVAAGLLLSLILLHPVRVPNRLWLVLTFAFPLGIGLMSLILFWSYALAPVYAKTVTIYCGWAVCAGLFLLDLRENMRGERRDVFSALKTGGESSPGVRDADMPDSLIYKISRTIFFVLALILFLVSLWWYVGHFAGEMCQNPYGGWDARYFYNLKARFFFRSPEHWTDMFNRLIGPKDYPLLLPGAVAWGWNWAGREIILWPNLVSLFFFLSLSFLILWYLGSYASWADGLLAAAFLLHMPSYRFWSLVQYADIPLSFYVTAAALFLITSLREGSPRILTLSGLAAGMAAWVKNEGLVFSAFLVAVTGLIFLMKKDMSGREKRNNLLALFSGLLPAFIAILFLRVSWGGAGDYWNPEAPGRSIRFLLDPLQWELLIASFVTFMRNFELWHGTWAASLAALVLFPGTWLKSWRWITLLLALALTLTYFGHLLTISSVWLLHPSYGFIKNALQRLLQHTTALALVFTFEIFGSARRKLTTI